ncbi:hypothetical protein TcasGA2_TC002457 [Tribolium castaneum]|uniref:Uncharacterized protein n=1 Tax=Tribolium castaneum TaxID=7070 RepID=D6WI37_TRICA|nr:hypothetical protein TcasGA2_TC002457 [Tribolium castaneum]
MPRLKHVSGLSENGLKARSLRASARRSVAEKGECSRSGQSRFISGNDSVKGEIRRRAFLQIDGVASLRWAFKARYW